MKLRRFLELECLESRVVPALVNTANLAAVNTQLNINRVHAILDFDGGVVSRAAMNNGGWTSNNDFPVKSFKDLFNSNNPWLDMNGDGNANLDDANLAIQQILAKVKADYAPYRIDINLGKHDDNEFRLTDGQVGDVIVMITGGANNLEDHDSLGVSPPLFGTRDHGNLRDEIAWAFGGSIASFNTFNISASRFINGVAHTISHEMGHCFGLDHVIIDPSNDAMTHFMMGESKVNATTEARDFSHDFNFQDIAYQTVTGGMQNSHQILSDTLGVSSGPWLAVIKPGELTISGTDGSDNIQVNPSTIANMWSITTNSVNRLLSLTSRSINALNPFDAKLSRINVFGKDGVDTIIINPKIMASTVIFGGRGDDYIYGGGGRDEMHGGGENDYLYGRGGNDFLFGDVGWDHLYGGIGNDQLDGGFDGIADVLRGQEGQDTFIIHKNWNFGTSYTEEIESTDFLGGIDFKVFQYHRPIVTTTGNAS